MVNEVKLKLSVEGAQAARGEIDSVNTTVGKMASGALTAAKAMAGVFAGFAASQTIGKLVSVQREFDVLNSSLITVTGSSAAAAKEMAWIKTFAKDTPFGLAQATQGFVKMKALGLDPTIGSLTSFGNTASAMGKDLNQMVEAVADAATGEFERLKDFGITARKQGDEVKLTFQGVTTTIGNNAKEITGYLEAIGNNQFARAMVERAKTLDGAIAALGDTWDALFLTVNTNNTGGFIYDSVTVATKAIEDATAVLNSMTTAASANARETGAMSTVQGALATVFETVAVLGVNVKYVLTGIGTELGGLAAQAVKILQGNFSGAAAIRREMMADAAAARREVDATTAAILMARENAKTAAAVNAQANARLARQSTDAIASVTTATQTHTAATKAQEAAAKAQEELVKQYTAQAQTLGDARNKEYDEIEKYMAAQRLAAIEAGNAADASVRAAQLELDQRGMLKSAIADTTVVRLQEQLTTKTAGTEAYDSLMRQIEAQKQLAGIYRSGEALDAVDDLRKENKKAAEESSKYWEDALMRAFESGKGFFQSLWDTIKNTLKTQVLKVFVSATGLTGMTAATAGQAGGFGDAGGIMNLASMGSNISTLWGGINTASGAITTGAVNAGKVLFNLGLNDAGQAMNEVGNLAVKYADQINLVGNSLSYLSAAAALADGRYGAAAGTAIGTYFGGPIGGSIGNAIGSAIDDAFGGGGGPKSSSAYNTAGVYDSDTSKTSLAATYGRGVEDAWATLAKQLELTTQLKVGTFVSVDSAGTAMTQLATSGTINGKEIYSRAGRGGGYENVGRSEEALQAAMAEETTRLLFAALKASDLPEQYKTYLSTIGDSVADMTEAMTIVAVVDDFNDALQSLPFENLKTLSFEAAKGLIEVAGGMDVLGANLGTYYTNFYSAEEQRAQTIKNINATVGNGFDAASTSAEQFRATVEAAMLDTSTEGLALTAKLLGVSGAMGTLTKESEAAAEALKKESEAAAEALKKALADLFGSLDDAVSAALSAVEAAVSAERDALSAAYDTQAQQISDSIDTVSASVGKLQSLADSLKSTLDGMRISGSDAQYRAAAQAQISAALATARAGGGLPLDGQLTSALATVSKPSEQLFATFEDYARDFYSTANDISALGDLTNDQLSLEQATLAALETQSAILEASYKAQLSILDATLANAQAQAGADSGLMTLSAALYALVNALSQKTYFEANADVADAYAKNDYGLSASDYATVHYGLYGKDEGRTSPNAPPADGAKSYFELYPDVAAAFKANSYGMDQIAYSARHFANFGKAEGRVFPGFAVGTNYVPSDMIAQIHEGEAIVPKAYNPAAGGQNNAELVAEIRALRQEVASLKASNEATAKATSKFASQFETASEGGRALLTEVYA